MLKLFTLCIENIKKQTDYYMVKKKNSKTKQHYHMARDFWDTLYTVYRL